MSKANILYPPYTEEERLKFVNNNLLESMRKLEKTNLVLLFENNKLKGRNRFLENLIEHTRLLWHKGERFAIKELLICLKSGKITEKYQSLLDV